MKFILCKAPAPKKLQQQNKSRIVPSAGNSKLTTGKWLISFIVVSFFIPNQLNAFRKFGEFGEFCQLFHLNWYRDWCKYIVKITEEISGMWQLTIIVCTTLEESVCVRVPSINMYEWMIVKRMCTTSIQHAFGYSLTITYFALFDLWNIYPNNVRDDDDNVFISMFMLMFMLMLMIMMGKSIWSASRLM